MRLHSIEPVPVLKIEVFGQYWCFSGVGVPKTVDDHGISAALLGEQREEVKLLPPICTRRECGSDQPVKCYLRTIFVRSNGDS